MGTSLIHHLLRQSASVLPNRAAVKASSVQITYGELNDLSDRVAATLQLAGVKKADRVGIYVPKTVASLISIYSILKSGGIYVPFDPDGPPERLASIAKDCGIRYILSSTAKRKGVDEIVSKGAPIRTVVNVDFDAPPQTKGPQPSENTDVLVIGWEEARTQNHPPGKDVANETDTAYILYTSGSTGVPKGVMISHRNSLAFVEWAIDCVGLGQDDIVACHAPLHFDISTFSIFSTCKVGGTVMMIPDKASLFPVELATLIEREGVTVWYSVPSALTLLTLHGNLGKRNLSKLRVIVFAGEVFPIKFLNELMSLVPRARYFNWYGPTETNVCTSYEVRTQESSSIPIGKASSGDEIFAVSDAGQLVKRPGENGELYVKGPTVMQGYWGDPEKTGRLLVPNPMNPASGERVCRTGDLVTLDAEGNYLYLGRRDGMIKTRGYRVELGDIEAAIYLHPAVKEAVVAPIADELIGNRIHAFISLHEDGVLSKGEIQAFVGSKLPRYMIPDTVSFMMSLPKTSSGKMDRVTLARSLEKEAGSSG